MAGKCWRKHQWELKTIRKTTASVSRTQDGGAMPSQAIVLELHECSRCGRKQCTMYDLQGRVTYIHPLFMEALSETDK